MFSIRKFIASLFGSLDGADLWQRRVIPVTGGYSPEQDINVKVYVDGVLESCNHADYESGPMEFERLEYDQKHGNYLPKTYMKNVDVCSGCGATRVDEGWEYV